jgi:hypothetical protein
MKYTVVWLTPAQNHLADIWTAAPDKPAVTAASNAIDGILGHDPYANSKPLSDNERVMFVDPLGVVYRVSDDDRLVTVSAVWRTSFLGEASNGKHQA